MMLVVIIGVFVLALDGVRYMSLQTQLQNGADALALAGAAELDRCPMRRRAIRAINNLLANSTLFGGEADRNVQVSRIDFYSQLPASDARPMSDGALAGGGTDARFVSVTVRPVTLSMILPASFFGGATAVAAGASAVAGFDHVICQATPLFVCNPYEVPGMSYEQASGALQLAAADPAMRRRLVRWHQYGNSDAPYLAGDYGFLDAPTVGNSTVAILDALAHTSPAACFVQNGVNFSPGAMAAVREGLNVRFDIYEGSMGARNNDPNYRPSSNVRKGYVGSGGGGGGNACAARRGPDWPIGTPPGQATGLPLDREWPYLDGRMGNGDWNFSTYWQVNHGADGRAPPTINGGPASNSNLPTRYGVYRYEIEQGYVTDRSPGGETGAPACYGGGVLSDAPDRRVLTCRHQLSEPGTARGIIACPVAAFRKLFLTLPLQQAQTDIYAEIVGLVKPATGPISTWFSSIGKAAHG